MSNEAEKYLNRTFTCRRLVTGEAGPERCSNTWEVKAHPNEADNRLCSDCGAVCSMCGAELPKYSFSPRRILKADELTFTVKLARDENERQRKFGQMQPFGRLRQNMLPQVVVLFEGLEGDVFCVDCKNKLYVGLGPRNAGPFVRSLAQIKEMKNGPKQVAALEAMGLDLEPEHTAEPLPKGRRRRDQAPPAKSIVAARIDEALSGEPSSEGEDDAGQEPVAIGRVDEDEVEADDEGASG